MKALSLKEFYAQSLELKTPWKVVDVMEDGESRQVRIRVELRLRRGLGRPRARRARGSQQLGGTHRAAS
jgi:hypothetical protein